MPVNCCSTRQIRYLCYILRCSTHLHSRNMWSTQKRQSGMLMFEEKKIDFLLKVERNGVGIMVEKEALSSEKPLVDAIRRIINEERWSTKKFFRCVNIHIFSYRATAKKVMQMIGDRPFAMKEVRANSWWCVKYIYLLQVFVRNMEFLAEYGPLNQLQHYGSKLSLVEYYLIDVFAFIVSFGFTLIFAGMFTVRKLISTISNFVSVQKLKAQ